jgi:ribulose-5-phosphate 4-epimerase/fuculose-1-phosphate aldolase
MSGASHEQHARIELAALFRMAALHQFHEGIDNHFSLALPEQPGRFLLNPYGPYWTELRARDLLVVDEEGTVIGEGEVERTAFALHSAVHRSRPDATCVLHTHMPYATALALTEDGLDTRLSQNAAKFHGAWAMHGRYDGLFTEPSECEAVAKLVGDGIRVLLLANHGVLVVGESPAHAWWDLYFLEAAARHQVLAQSTGASLRRMSEETAALAAQQVLRERDESPKLFAAMRRLLDRELPGYDD